MRTVVTLLLEALRCEADTTMSTGPKSEKQKEKFLDSLDEAELRWKTFLERAREEERVGG